MMTVALDRLFQDSLAIALERNGMPDAVIGAIATCPPETRREISALLGELITAETQNAGIEIEETDGTRMAPEQLRSAIFSQRSSGVTQKITFLRIKDAMYETLVPLLSMVLTFGSHDMKAAV